MIQLGASGDYVRVWQRIVGASVDGHFGPATDSKVRAWQGARGVEPDGVIGNATRALLKPGDIIKPYEGFRGQTYDDHDGAPLTLDIARVWRRPDGGKCMGYPTIGWGRRLWPNEFVTRCTLEDGDTWFDQDLARTRLPALHRAFSQAKLDEEPGRMCAAASFAYNDGTGALAKLAAGGFLEATWRSYDHTRGVEDVGLRVRRAEEWSMWAGLDG